MCEVREVVTITDSGSSYFKEKAEIVYTSPTGQIVVQYEDGVIEIMFDSDLKRE